MLDFLNPVWFPQTLAAVLMGLLAVWLLVVDFNKTPHRVFAAILLFRALTLFVGMLRARSTDPAAALYYDRIAPYPLLPIVPLTIYFLCVYPRPRTWLGKSKWGGPVVMASIALLWGLYAFDHTLLWTVEPGNMEGFAAAFVGYHYTAFGPLVIATSLWSVAFSAVTVRLAFDYLDTANRSPRFSAILIYAGFALNSLFDGGLRLLQAIITVRDGADFPWLPWGWAIVLLPALTLVPVLVSAYILYFRRDLNADVRRDVNRFLVVGSLALASGLGLGILGRNPSVFLMGPGSFAHFLLGVWRLSLPILVSYALLRYDLFDIDHKVKSVVKHGTIVGAPVSVFFAMSELTEGLIQNQVGAFYGLAAAIAVSLAFKPLEKWAGRFVARLFPHIKPFDALSVVERRALFEEQLRLAQQDGDVSPKEQRMLDLLSQRLGLPPDPLVDRATRRRAAYS